MSDEQLKRRVLVYLREQFEDGVAVSCVDELIEYFEVERPLIWHCLQSLAESRMVTFDEDTENVWAEGARIVWNCPDSEP